MSNILEDKMGIPLLLLPLLLLQAFEVAQEEDADADDAAAEWEIDLLGAT